MKSDRVVGVMEMRSGQRIPVTESRPCGKSFGIMFRTTFETDDADRLVKQISSAPTLKVLALLPRKLSYELFKRVDQVALSKELEISTGAASRALNELHELGFLERQGTGPVTMWRLSSDFGWRGTVDGFHATSAKRESQRHRH